MPVSWNPTLSSSPSDLPLLFMCFCSSCNDSSSYCRNENIIKSIFIAVANALVSKGHLDIILSELAQLWQYHSGFILPFIITHRTVKDHMLSALNLGGIRFAQIDPNKREATQSLIHFALFNHTHPPYLLLSLGGEWSLPGRERLITFRINQRAAHPLDDISECSSNPWVHKQLCFFFRFVSDVRNRINNE